MNQKNFLIIYINNNKLDLDKIMDNLKNENLVENKYLLKLLSKQIQIKYQKINI